MVSYSAAIESFVISFSSIVRSKMIILSVESYNPIMTDLHS